MNDSEQAISQLVLSVQGNTNEESISAYFQGSQLIVSAISENFYGMSIGTLTLRADDGNESSEAFVDVSIDPVNDNPVIISYNGSPRRAIVRNNYRVVIYRVNTNINKCLRGFIAIISSKGQRTNRHSIEILRNC